MRGDFFHNKRYLEDLRTKSGGLMGGHEPPRRALGGRLAGSWAPRGSFALPLSPINSLKSQNQRIEPQKYFSAAASFCFREIPSIDHSGALPEGDSDTKGFFINTIASPMMRE